MILRIGLLALLLVLGGRAFALEKPYQVGIASVYWEGNKVATGHRYDKWGVTVAHKELPFGTLVRVTILGTRRNVEATVNDRGPFVKGRVIDLSLGTARQVGLGRSLARVRIDIVRTGRHKPLEPMFAHEAYEKLQHVAVLRERLVMESTKRWRP